MTLIIGAIISIILISFILFFTYLIMALSPTMVFSDGYTPEKFLKPKYFFKSKVDIYQWKEIAQITLLKKGELNIPSEKMLTRFSEKKLINSQCDKLIIYFTDGKREVIRINKKLYDLIQNFNKFIPQKIDKKVLDYFNNVKKN